MFNKTQANLDSSVEEAEVLQDSRNEKNHAGCDDSATVSPISGNAEVVPVRIDGILNFEESHNEVARDDEVSVSSEESQDTKKKRKGSLIKSLVENDNCVLDLSTDRSSWFETLSPKACEVFS